jgi:hypothetical protein
MVRYRNTLRVLARSAGRRVSREAAPPAVLGPEDLSFNDMARVMSDVLVKRVRYQQVSLQDYKATLMRNGMSEAMADVMSAKDQGLDNAEPRTPESTTPTTFRQWCGEVLKPAVLKEPVRAASTNRKPSSAEHLS